MNIAKQYQIQINGLSYTLVSDESEDHIKKVVNLVEIMIKDIIQRGIQNETKVATLVCLQLASLHIKKEEIIQAIEQKHNVIRSKIDSV